MQVLYPNFLWALLAVGGAILIHLLQLRRPQRVLFTNTGFIREVELTINRQRRLQELLILFTRIAAITLLVLAFCQPYIPAKEKKSSNGYNDVAVLIDNTPSMQAQGTRQDNLLQEALAEARILSKSYDATSKFELINEHAGTATRAGYEAKLADIEAAKGKVNWDKLSSQYLVKSSNQQPLYIFSDFQKDSDSNSFFFEYTG